jgi:hypothetical protein
MSTVEEFKRSVQVALEASASISDPDLRRIAFDRILTESLRRSEATPPAASAGVGSSHRGPPRSRSEAPPGPSHWVDDLLEDEFFTKPRTIADVVDAVRAAGHNVLSKDVTYPLSRLVQQKGLRREKGLLNDTRRSVWVYRNY